MGYRYALNSGHYCLFCSLFLHFVSENCSIRVYPYTPYFNTLFVLPGINARFIEDNGIGPGAKIRVVRSGDVIPKITDVLARVAPKMPDVPYGWDETRVHAMLSDSPDANKEVEVKLLTKFFTDMKIDNVKEGLVSKFYDNGLRSLDDYLLADVPRLLQLPGVSSVLATKLVDNIHGRVVDADIVTVMAASNVFGTGIGSRKLTALLHAIPDILTTTDGRDVLIAAICKIDGFQQKTAQKVADHLEDFKAFLAAHPQITLARPPATSSGQAAQPSPLAGLAVVFTGFRNAVWEKKLADQGGRLQSSVSAKTNILVTKDPESTTGKAQKARDLGVRVIGLEEFEAILEADTT